MFNGELLLTFKNKLNITDCEKDYSLNLKCFFLYLCFFRVKKKASSKIEPSNVEVAAERDAASKSLSSNGRFE